MIFSVLQRQHDVLKIAGVNPPAGPRGVMGPTVLFQDSLGFGAGELLVTMDPSGLGNQVGTKVFRVDFLCAKSWCWLVSFEFGRVRI